jgi:hypothetical protein
LIWCKKMQPKPITVPAEQIINKPDQKITYIYSPITKFIKTNTILI